MAAFLVGGTLHYVLMGAPGHLESTSLILALVLAAFHTNISNVLIRAVPSDSRLTCSAECVIKDTYSTCNSGMGKYHGVGVM